jgi:dTMP kinase
VSITQRGLFITLEGVDGAGKSTHAPWIVEHLRQRGIDVLATREPGGTAFGEQLRKLLLTEPMHLKTETLLMFAGRAEHVEAVIKPALARGQWVVCDRFTDATYAYQGGGRQLGAARIQALEAWVHAELQPDRTWLFDVPLAIARERLGRSRNLDRFEQEGADFFERTRQAYHDRAAQDPARVHIVDSTRPIETVKAGLAREVDALIHEASLPKVDDRP